MGVTMLGPVGIDGDRTGLAPRDRIVLAALAMSPHEVVTPDRLADALWDEQPPDTWTKVVQGSISRIRKALGPTAIRTARQGYVLDLSDDAIDGLRFEQLVRRARELLTLNEPDRALYTLTQALDLWYGPALADLSGWSPGEAAADRWEELRRDAEELWVEAGLASGDWREVLTDAGRLVADQPFRENRWALLARAQYQAGRQGEALATLQRARAVLAGELGLDPGPELGALEQAILTQDPALLPAAGPTQTTLVCPYRGLLAYDIDDAEQYFGRDAEVAACLDLLAHEHVVAVVGASGSGKSSLVRAGLAATLRRTGRSVAVMTPGAHPRAALEQIGGLRPRGVVVVDQLEEAVTLCENPAERTAFLDALAGHAQSGTDLVITVRADRLAAFSGHRSFARTLERGLHLLSGMGEEDLRSAVEGPARQAGLLIEPGLVDLLVHEVSGEPGALPLLSHALSQTWERREGRTLTVEGYRASGGIQGAVARSAEQVFLGLDEEDQRAARALLLRLVVPVSAGEPTRSRIPRRSVASDARHEQIVEMLVAARLVTSDGETVELAHESLAQAWPRLRGWLDADTEGQLLLRHLAVAADSWDAMGRPDSELYRGTRLAQVREWHAAGSADLTRAERDFLQASQTLARTEARSAEERLREHARRNRRLRGLLVAVVAVLAVALVAGGLAVRESRRADAQADLATVRELAAASRAVRAEDPELAVLLALEASAPSLAGDQPVREAVEALHSALAASRLVMTVEGAGGSVSWSPDGRFLAHEGPEDSGLVEVLDATTGEPALSFAGHDIDVNEVAFGPDGRLATTGDDGALRVWGPRSDELLAEVVGDGPVWSPSFATRGPGRVAAVWRDEGQIRVATVGGDGSPSVTTLAVEGRVAEAVLSPDGQWMAAVVGDPPSAVIVDARTGRVRHRLSGHTSPVLALAISPDGRWVASGARDGRLRIHDAATGDIVHTPGDAQSSIFAVAWSPDSGRLAVSEEQGEIRVFEVTERAVRQSVTLPGASTGAGLIGLAFGPDGSRLLGGDWTITTASVWDVGLSGDAEVMNVRGAPGAHGTAFGPEGRLFTLTDGPSVTVHDGPDDGAPVRLTLPGTADRPDAPFRALDVSADGSAVGIGNSLSGAAVWDLDSGDLLFSTPTSPAQDRFRSRTTFSPDGQYVAVAGVSRIEVRSRDGIGVARLDATAGYAFRDPVFDPDGEVVAAFRFPLDGTQRNQLPGDPFPLQARPDWDVVWWNWRSGEVRETPKTGYGHDPEFSPDGTRLAMPAVGGATEVLDIASGAVAHTLEGHEAGVISLDFSPDGRRVATGGLEGRTIIWDARTGAQLLQLPLSDHEVSSVSFSPDGRHLATDSLLTDVVRVWTLDVAELRHLAAEQVPRDFTAAECRQYLHRACDTPTPGGP
ncbi:BTAD domain-containing putative transcriptional regulator [uncultured Phycicoccus sp.]|uniref:nSTAND1 domain-containing NTPase n=1 Tax=uncultured Phycicoccus sp. TaxID=661422 RepID=UPI00261FDEBF|nr:BTAD domain-containing putative transcriptional regulator [uncultured Phycicoccus sp.]